MKISDLIGAIEDAAPRALQESYDNSGLQLGDCGRACTGALLTVDVTPAVVNEAIECGCNLIISHHPLLFNGLKRITGSTDVEVSVALALKHDITIYSAHTSIDSAPGGISWTMSSMLGLKNAKVLEPAAGKMSKLVTYVPVSHAQSVRQAMFDAGAGHIGNYDSCSYNIEGSGTFRALNGANPFVGDLNRIHVENETRIEVIVPDWKTRDVEQALLAAHPYEEPAYEFLSIANPCKSIGLGCVGDLEQPLAATDFVDLVKSTFGVPVARCTNVVNSGRLIKRVGLCGGSGSSMIRSAVGAGADAYITSDTSYHNFVDMADRLLIVYIGHHESESCSKAIFYRIITEKFPNFAVRYAHTDYNPINYV